ncbi:hypothetical protein P7D52_00145 [Enterococcus dongliensis]|uniref:hypothetical protein n=1 Tax=Enterococcus TaxID=1350 RepID=UPI00288FB86D|nr:hypothetical protein [Enterococcus dongliensis]MDT2640472.1 hypothetical protein [Enterococcus dongliensis]MDT2641222.1 hypothetical protein [Enterococcus dongliensis]MDT2677325.1 hypothetical protein [Enterococcus dongliensis]NBK09783.1 hypothetical protein [Enterococcus asini]
MYVMQLILENGVLLKITGSQDELVPLRDKIEKEPSLTKFIKLTDSLTVKPRTICAIEIFDVTEGVIEDEN